MHLKPGTLEYRVEQLLSFSTGVVHFDVRDCTLRDVRLTKDDVVVCLPGDEKQEADALFLFLNVDVAASA